KKVAALIPARRAASARVLPSARPSHSFSCSWRLNLEGRAIGDRPPLPGRALEEDRATGREPAAVHLGFLAGPLVALAPCQSVLVDAPSTVRQDALDCSPVPRAPHVGTLAGEREGVGAEQAASRQC